LIVNGLGIGEYDLPPQIPAINSFKDVNKKIKMNLPNLSSMGLLKIADEPLYNKPENLFIYGKLKKQNNGKNIIYDYMEFFGNTHTGPLINLIHGVPENFLKKIEKKVGLQFIGNIHTEHSKAIDEFGDKHIKTGKPILYLSNDNSLHVAANTNIITKERLYEICEIVASELKINFGIDKVTARPFGGTPGYFYRMYEKKEFLYKPKEKMLISKLAKKTKVILLSNLSELFIHIKNCSRVLSPTDEVTLHQLNKIFDMKFNGVVFAGLTNLYKYGKQSDLIAYAHELEKIDSFIGHTMEKINENDIFFVVGNHGCCPISKGNESGHEYVPFLSYRKNNKKTVHLKTVEYSYIIKGLLDYHNIKNYPDNMLSQYIISN